MKYRHKPTEVEAIQWTGNNLDELQKFVPSEFRHNKIHQPIGIITLHGPVSFKEGDWIVRGDNPENYWPVDPVVFENSYEKANKEAT